MSEADRTRLRRTAFGFVFQFGQLVPELTAADNVALPLLLNRTKRKVAYKTADTWLDRLGIGDKGGRRTGELSGGEGQRVAVARALALAPKVIFADEPTGSLDSLTGEKVMDLTTGLAREQGATVVHRHPRRADRGVRGPRGNGPRRRRLRGRPSRRRPLRRGEGRGLMFRLGLQLTLRSGREGLVRLLITAAAVAVGVALLLGVLAEFHAFQANANQPCWSCTQGAPVPGTLPAHGELWNNSVDFYQGQTVSRLDVAALGPGAPVPPGIAQLPPRGRLLRLPRARRAAAVRARQRTGRAVPRQADRHDRPGRAQRGRRPGHLHRAHARRRPAPSPAPPGSPRSYRRPPRRCSPRSSGTRSGSACSPCCSPCWC